MKKILLASVAITGVAGLVYYASISESPYLANVQPTGAEKHQHSHTNESLPNTPVTRGEQVLSTGVDVFEKKSKTDKAEMNLEGEVFEKDTIIWQESEEAKEALQASGFIPADVVDEAYVEIDLEELKTVEVGEFIDLYIPQFGGSYTGEVDYIQTHSNGDRTVEALIPGAGSLYAAVITIGENAIYGNLATPRDVFVLEGTGQHAWIAPKSSMMGSHIENTPTEMSGEQLSDIPDVFVPPENLSPADEN